MSNTEELLELTELVESTSNEKKEGVVSFGDSSVGDAVNKLSEDAQSDLKNNEKNNTKDDDNEENEIQVLLKEADKVATSRIVKLNKVNRYRRPVFWIQHVQHKHEPNSKGEVGLEKLDNLNPDNQYVRCLQEALEPKNEYLKKKEFDYNPTTKNGFLRRVFVILLVMLIVTAALELIYLKIEKLRVNVELPASGYSIFAYSGIALLMIYYFWTCSSWPKEKPYFLYVSLVLAVLAMSWLILGISFALQTYVFFFALYGLIVAALVCLLLTCIPRFNFTKWWLYVVVLLAVLSSLVLCLWVVSRVFSDIDLRGDVIYSFLASTVVVILLILELQLVLTYRTVTIEEDEYSLVACLMYASSVTIFVKLILTFDVIDAE